MEIERKFTLKRLPKNLSQYECKVIEQGYLCKSPTVRIRKSNNDYILTYKSKYGIDTSGTDVLMSNEVEVPLDQAGYEHLKTKIDDKIVEKRRYIIPLENGLKVELDIFEGYLKGLILAEVEFPTKEEAEAFVMPDWFDQDVSADSRYKNTYLSQVESYEAM